MGVIGLFLGLVGVSRSMSGRVVESGCCCPGVEETSTAGYVRRQGSERPTNVASPFRCPYVVVADPGERNAFLTVQSHFRIAGSRGGYHAKNS